jgi:hypothetical protein
MRCMWLRFPILVLCAMPALWADMCDGLSTGPPKGAALYGSNGPLSFKLALKPAGTAFRITVRPKWQINADDVIIDKTRAGEIEVARCEDGRRLQVLAIAADQPMNFGSMFRADDINFDGYLDFSVVSEYAASSGFRRSYWVYDPGSQLFVQNELTREVADWWGFVDVDPTKQEITRQYFGAMMGCPATSEGREERYRVNKNRLLLVHKKDFERQPQSCTVTESDLIDGTMRVTKVRRFDTQGRRLK